MHISCLKYSAVSVSTRLFVLFFTYFQQPSLKRNAVRNKHGHKLQEQSLKYGEWHSWRNSSDVQVDPFLILRRAVYYQIIKWSLLTELSIDCQICDCLPPHLRSQFPDVRLSRLCSFRQKVRYSRFYSSGSPRVTKSKPLPVAWCVCFRAFHR